MIGVIAIVIVIVILRFGLFGLLAHWNDGNVGKEKPFGNDISFGDEITEAEENFKKGNEYFEKNDINMARYHYDKVILDLNKDLEMLARLNRGLLYYNLGNHGDAYGDWNYVLRYDKNPERIAAAKKLFEKLPGNWRP